MSQSRSTCSAFCEVRVPLALPFLSLRFDRYVEALVLDPSSRGTAVEIAGRSTGLEVRWHPGYELRAGALDALDGYRGAQTAEAGRELAVGGVLTPAALAAARSAGTYDAQTLKHVWHLLAAFGRRT